MCDIFCLILPILLMIIPLTILNGLLRAKYAELVNPISIIEGNENEVGFADLEMVKTRNIF